MLDRATNSIEERVERLAMDLLKQNGIVRPVARDARLTDAGLTSVDMVAFMLAVEAEFDVLIPPAEITPENFRSIASVEAMLARMQEAGFAAGTPDAGLATAAQP